MDTKNNNQFSSIFINVEEKTFTLNPPDENFFIHAYNTYAQERERVRLQLFNSPLPANIYNVGWYNEWFVFPCLPAGSAVILPDKKIVLKHTDIFTQETYSLYKTVSPTPVLYIPNQNALHNHDTIYITFNIQDTIALLYCNHASVTLFSSDNEEKEFLNLIRNKKIIFLCFKENDFSIAIKTIEKNQLNNAEIVELSEHPSLLLWLEKTQKINELLKLGRASCRITPHIESDNI